MRPSMKPIAVLVLTTILVTGCATTGTETTSSEPVAKRSEAKAPPLSPPPPPPPPVPVAESDVAGRADLGEVVAFGAAKEAAPQVGTAPPSDIQAGTLTAGDYDDVLNPDLYQAYVDKMLDGPLARKDLPYVDAANRVAIKVLDKSGEPMPHARLSMRTSTGDPMFPLRTGANGLTYLYPKYDVFDAGATVTVSVPGARAQTQVLSAPMLQAGGELTFEMTTQRKTVSELDLLLTLDATGSMTDEMRYLQVELTSILDRLKSDHPALDIRVGFVAYRDHGDAFLVQQEDFTSDFPSFNLTLGALSADGGGDTPEAMMEAMSVGLDLNWRKDAAKINLLVADAPPHDEDLGATWDTALIARSRGVQIAPLAASGVDDTAEFLMRSMSQITGGRYMFLTDDSGVGNPHAEPDVDCYVVTRLDGMMLRVLEDLVTGERREPTDREIIRRVGDYDQGVCGRGQTEIG